MVYVYANFHYEKSKKNKRINSNRFKDFFQNILTVIVFNEIKKIRFAINITFFKHDRFKLFY